MPICLLPITSSFIQGKSSAPQYRVQWINGSYYTFGGVALNNRGQVAATAEDHVVVWEDGRTRIPAGLKNLGSLNVVPFGISDRGTIVGTMIVARSGAISYDELEGFIWNGK